MGKAGVATGWVRHPRRVVGCVDRVSTRGLGVTGNVEEAGLCDGMGSLLAKI
jgi:hypothetical protein